MPDIPEHNNIVEMPHFESGCDLLPYYDVPNRNTLLFMRLITRIIALRRRCWKVVRGVF